MKKYILYYILGSLSVGLSLLGIIICFSLPLANEEFSQNAGWILVIVMSILFIFILLGIFLLKKGNYLKLDEIDKREILENEKAIREMLDKKYDEIEKNHK